MKLIVGLGNPGAKYKNNRHNIGFNIVDNILKDNNFSNYKEKFQSHYCEGRIADEKVVLLKPQTYMNESGRAVQLACNFYKIPPNNLYVFHDELDLIAGKTRTKFGGGHAGHNGLRSIQACLGTPDFNRIRCGIGHPGHKDRVHSYVLSDFSKAERENWVDNYVETCARFIDLLLLGQEGDYMTRVAQHAPVTNNQTK